MNERAEIDDVACPVCDCVCDDLRVTVEQDRIVAVKGSCPLSEPWLLEPRGADRPVAEVDGESVELDSAVIRAAEILAEARWPLVSGLSRSTTAGQRAAVALADQLGACIDACGGGIRAAATLAIQQNGISTCTLGEVRHRADLVIFWGVDPLTTHPRHWERYSVEPSGRFLPGGRRDRRVLVLDTQRTRSAAQADQFIRLDLDQQFEFLWCLRALVRGMDVPDGQVAGVAVPVIRELAERMKACRYGIVFFGERLAPREPAHRHVEALLRLVTELNEHTKFHARAMQGANAAGAANVLCWQTGYPMAVGFHRGYPLYGPGEYSAEDVLQRGEVDACLLVGSECVSRLKPGAREHLQRIPSIVLDHPSVESPLNPRVRFTAAVDGIHRAGTVYRMDDVPVPLRALLESPYPSDAEILERIGRAVAAH